MPKTSQILVGVVFIDNRFSYNTMIHHNTLGYVTHCFMTYPRKGITNKCIYLLAKGYGIIAFVALCH